MAKSIRTPYEAQIKKLAGFKRAWFDQRYNIYAVLDISSISIRWKSGEREICETDTIYPGMALYPKSRPLAKWEKEMSLEEREKLGIDLKKNQVKIVVRFSDLWSAIRQRGRHIADELIQRKIVINKEEEIIIAGEAQKMKDLALILNGFTNRFLAERITLKLREDFSREAFLVYQELEGTKDEFKKKAAQTLKQTLDGGGVKTPVKLLESSVQILNRWVKVLDIAESCLKQAENWLLLCQEIEMKVSFAYKRLAELNAELQKLSESEKAFSIKKLLQISNEIEGIRVYLSRGVLYQPYYQRVWSKEVQNLSKAREYAEAGKVKPMLNLANKALSKLGAIVISEKPTLKEIKARRLELPKG